MPIALTVAMDPGNIDTAVCDHVKIMGLRDDERLGEIHMELEYGTIVATVWTPSGVTPTAASSFPDSAVISGADYATLATTHMTLDGELTKAAAKRALYEWLKVNYAALAGAIV